MSRAASEAYRQQRIREGVKLGAERRKLVQATGVPPQVVIVAGRRRSSLDGDAIVLDFHRHEIGRWGHAVTFTPRMFRFVSVLLVSAGWVGIETVADAVWGDDESGGPIDPSNNLSQIARHCRPRLEALGIAIATSGRNRRVAVLPYPYVTRALLQEAA